MGSVRSQSDLTFFKHHNSTVSVLVLGAPPNRLKLLKNRTGIINMASVETKDFSTQADEVMTPSNARVEMVNVGGQRVMKLTA